MDIVRGNPFSHLTAKERDRLSFPARVALERDLLKGKVLDFGCGFGSDTALLKGRGIDINGYDPHYFPGLPTQRFDTIICFYVLNVLLPEQQAEVLMDVSTLLSPTGRAYFAVRRDLQHEGFRIHKLHKKPTYQCNVTLPFVSVLRNEYCEIYEYRPYTVLHQGRAEVSPFLSEEEPRELLVETATAFSIYDKFPVSAGHVLVIPKRLVADYFALTAKEQFACWLVVNRVQKVLAGMHKPDGFNVGLNISEAGGQTVQHVHVHVIPRYSGDVENPRGGIRGVLPDKKEY